MHDEAGFVRAVLANPDDATTRLVYADWLDERGDARGEFLRLHAELAGLPPDGERAFWARGRLDELRRGIDGDWLVVFDRPPVENCGMKFKFRCPREWDKLRPTENCRVRFCETCRKSVYYCRTVKEAQDHTLMGHCVAVDARQMRTEGDLPLVDHGVAESVLHLGMMDDDGEDREHERDRSPRAGVLGWLSGLFGPRAK